MRGNCRGGGAPLLRTLKDVERKALEKGICLYRGPVGEPGRGLIDRELRETDVGGLDKYVKEGPDH